MNPPESVSDFLASSSRPENARLTEALLALAEAGRGISGELRAAALRGNLGFAEGRRRKLSLLANQLIMDSFRSRKSVAAVISSELEQPLLFASGPEEKEQHLWLGVAPLEGSANVDVNGTLGTIFGVYRGARPEPGRELPLLAAGYFVYGPATMLVLSTGEQVRGFTLDPATGRFSLSHPEIRCPRMGAYLCGNFTRRFEWPEAARRFVESILAPAADGQPTCSLVYSGGLAADAHRVLLEGGICLSPSERAYPDGKGRLLYEALPLAYLFEKAGGRSTDGSGSLLKHPASGLIHERTHLALGSERNMEHYARLLSELGPPAAAELRWRAEQELGGDKESA